MKARTILIIFISTFATFTFGQLQKGNFIIGGDVYTEYLKREYGRTYGSIQYQHLF